MKPNTKRNRLTYKLYPSHSYCCGNKNKHALVDTLRKQRHDLRHSPFIDFTLYDKIHATSRHLERNNARDKKIARPGENHRVPGIVLYPSQLSGHKLGWRQSNYGKYGKYVHEFFQFVEENRLLDVQKSVEEWPSGRIRMKDARGRTGLFIACEFGYLTIAQYLYEQGASLHTPAYSFSCTPLEVSIYQTHLIVIEWLIAEGCELRRPLTKCIPDDLQDQVWMSMKRGWEKRRLHIRAQWNQELTQVKLLNEFICMLVLEYAENSMTWEKNYLDHGGTAPRWMRRIGAHTEEYEPPRSCLC